jgi:hypothetical protein
MSTVIKLKRSETAGVEPTTSTITQGEVAVNIVDKIIFIRDSNNNIVKVANFSEGSGSGTVTSVGGTGTVNGITLTGTVTSSGNLTLGGALTDVNLTSQVTGTLPVANGGTGITSLGAGVATFLGTPSSANLLAAVTDETGTGDRKSVV